jgi:hypothetical protein
MSHLTILFSRYIIDIKNGLLTLLRNWSVQTEHYLFTEVNHQYETTDIESVLRRIGLTHVSASLIGEERVKGRQELSETQRVICWVFEYE